MIDKDIKIGSKKTSNPRYSEIMGGGVVQSLSSRLSSNPDNYMVFNDFLDQNFHLSKSHSIEDMSKQFE